MSNENNLTPEDVKARAAKLNQLGEEADEIIQDLLSETAESKVVDELPKEAEPKVKDEQVTLAQIRGLAQRNKAIGQQTARSVRQQIGKLNTLLGVVKEIEDLDPRKEK